VLATVMLRADTRRDRVLGLAPMPDVLDACSGDTPLSRPAWNHPAVKPIGAGCGGLRSVPRGALESTGERGMAGEVRRAIEVPAHVSEGISVTGFVATGPGLQCGRAQLVAQRLGLSVGGWRREACREVLGVGDLVGVRSGAGYELGPERWIGYGEARAHFELSNRASVQLLPGWH